MRLPKARMGICTILPFLVAGLIKRRGPSVARYQAPGRSCWLFLDQISPNNPLSLKRSSHENNRLLAAVKWVLSPPLQPPWGTLYHYSPMFVAISMSLLANALTSVVRSQSLSPVIPMKIAILLPSLLTLRSYYNPTANPTTTPVTPVLNRYDRKKMLYYNLNPKS